MTHDDSFENATIDDVFIAIVADAERSTRSRARSTACGNSVAHLDVKDFLAAAADFTLDLDDLSTW